jgi:hypothetical protein
MDTKWMYPLFAFGLAAVLFYGAANSKGSIRVVATMMALACAASGIGVVAFLAADWGKFWG